MDRRTILTGAAALALPRGVSQSAASRQNSPDGVLLNRKNPSPETETLRIGLESIASR
jgi:hypothetical protein